MLIPIIVGSIAVILAYLSQSSQNGIGLKAAFLIIFVFLALRYDYGNDYMGYLDRYNEITSNVQISITEMGWEPGWIFLHVVFKPFGFFVMVMFTSLLTCIVFYRFIRNYVPASYQWFAVFLYVFDPYLLLVPASAMRQNIGILAFLVGIDCLHKRGYVLYVLLALAAATFHKSGVILLPFVLLPFINFRVNKVFALGFIGLFVSFFYFGHILVPFAFRAGGTLVESYIETYAYGTNARQAALGTGIGFFYNLFLFSVVLYFAGKEMAAGQQDEGDNLLLESADQEYDLQWSANDYPDLQARRILFKIAILTFLFVPLGFQAAMIGRFSMYFTPILIAVYPIIACTTKDRFFKLVFLGSLIPFTLFRFWAFFVGPGWKEKFGTYRTIFSAPQWY